MPEFKPSPNPPGCQSVEDHERALTSLADELETERRELTGDDRIAMATRKELALAAIRARKIASELAARRLEVDHSRWLVREYERMSGGNVTERPRLRLKRNKP